MQHYPQTQPWGCIYHAAASASGHPELLTCVDDLSGARLAIRLAACGYLLAPQYCDWTRPHFPDHLFDFPGSRALCLIRGWRGLWHSVAIEILEGAEVLVCDSAMSEPQIFTREAFLASRYAQTYEVMTLNSIHLDDHPHEDAQDGLRKALEEVKHGI